MELFCPGGCLTDEALRAIVDGTLDETQRLAASEHLSRCDDCLLRYTDLLSGETLETPDHPVAEPALQRIRARSWRVFIRRVTRAAAAVVLALALWSAGVFTSLVPQRPAAPEIPDYAPPVNAALLAHDFFTEAGDSIGSALSNFFSGLTVRR